MWLSVQICITPLYVLTNLRDKTPVMSSHCKICMWEKKLNVTTKTTNLHNTPTATMNAPKNPLCQNGKLFPSFTTAVMKRSINHRNSFLLTF